MIPTSPEMQRYVADRMVVLLREQEEMVRSLLARWVSELEPVILYYDYPMLIKGLGIAGDPTGTVFLRPESSP